MALDRNDLESAVVFLERAYSKEPHNQATLKTLGYAYLWTGQPDLALDLFKQVEEQSLLVAELEYWSWWYGNEDQEDRSTYALEMVQRLGVDEDETRPR